MTTKMKEEPHGGVSNTIRISLVQRSWQHHASHSTCIFSHTDLWRDDREGEDEGSGTIVFVYVWTIVSLIALAICGNRMIANGNERALFWTLCGFANYAFVVCVLVGGLEAIQVEGREIEETGWYGQSSVLLFLTCIFGIINSLVFAFWINRRAVEATKSAEMQQQFIVMDDGPSATVL